jgi:hypothetical protein
VIVDCNSVPAVRAASILLGVLLASTLVSSRPVEGGTPSGRPTDAIGIKWEKITVDLPVSRTPFPQGVGSDIATGQCLICHSAGMVLRQPPLTLDEWTTEVNKMRNAYGAPIGTEQVGAVADYLHRINGR